MKNLILLLAIFFFFIGCGENPVNNYVSEEIKSEKIPADTMYFEIHQNYGFCDTSGCYTFDTLLISGKAISDRGYGYCFTTSIDSAWGYNQWLKYTNCYFIYRIIGSYSFYCFLDDGVEFYANGNNYEILYLNSKTNYNIGIQ